MIPTPNVSNDALPEVLAVADAVLHDPAAPPRFALPCLHRAWVLVLGNDEDIVDQLAAFRPLSKKERSRFADAWRQHRRGEAVPRDALLAQVRAIRRTMRRPNRRSLLAAWGLAALALTAVFSLRVASGSVAMTSGVPLGPWRVEVFAIKEFRGPSVTFRGADASFVWKGPPHETMPKDKFATRLTTCLELDRPTKIEFVLHADDGARLYVDGNKQIEAWSKKGKTKRATVELSGGVHHLRLDHHDKKGTATVHLTASVDGAQPAPIPRSMLRYSSDPDRC